MGPTDESHRRIQDDGHPQVESAASIKHEIPAGDPIAVGSFDRVKAQVGEPALDVGRLHRGGAVVGGRHGPGSLAQVHTMGPASPWRGPGNGLGAPPQESGTQSRGCYKHGPTTRSGALAGRYSSAGSICRKRRGFLRVLAATALDTKKWQSLGQIGARPGQDRPAHGDVDPDGQSLAPRPLRTAPDVSDAGRCS